MNQAWADYFAWLSTPRPEFGGLPACPYIKGARFHLVPPDEDMVLLPVPANLTPSDMRTHAGYLNRSLTELNWQAITLHPDDPFNIRGLHTRRAPDPRFVLIRADVGNRASESLKRNTAYYSNWTEENLRDFPGL